MDSERASVVEDAMNDTHPAIGGLEACLVVACILLIVAAIGSFTSKGKGNEMADGAVSIEEVERIMAMVERDVLSYEASTLARHIQRLDAEGARLREALMWYASPIEQGTYEIVEVKKDGTRGFLSDMSTWGDRARAALAEGSK